MKNRIPLLCLCLALAGLGQARSLAPAAASVTTAAATLPAPTPAKLRAHADLARVYAEHFRTIAPTAAGYFDGRAAAFEDVAGWLEASASTPSAAAIPSAHQP